VACDFAEQETTVSRLQRRLAVLVVCGCLVGAVPTFAGHHAGPNAVTFWNDVALRAVTAGRPGPVGFLDVAVVQAAVHDAVQAFEGRFAPYLVTIRHASGSPEAAVAAAAHDVLVGLYPAQKTALDADYLTWLEANGLTGDPGAAVGQKAAAALLTQYRPAPNPPLPPYIGAAERGVWRPTPSEIGAPPSPPSFAPMANLFLAFTRPFTLRHAAQFRPAPPPRLKSERYRRDYDEVRILGARFNSGRTAEQTDLAYFWSDNVVTQWNRALRGIAEARLSLGESARLFALANLATADALISCWDSKYHYSFWRPITAIREGDDDLNPETQGDATWQPLVNTPNYPDYTSGANSVSGAMTATLRFFFGDDEHEFTITSNAPPVVQRTRTYARFSDAAQEVVEARMLLGIHFRFADVEARRQGTRVAHWTFTNFLEPRRKRDK
jgi:hypothetical protein